MPGDNDQIGLMSEEAIDKALEAARARVARAERERTELDRVIAAAREEQNLLERLLVLRRGGAVGRDGEPTEQERDPLRAATTGEAKHPAVQTVIKELGAAGRPLHISELMRLLRSQKVSIPGAGTQANLITHLRRDERFVHPSRGMYGLAAWGIESMPAVRRTRRRRKRMRSTRTGGRTEV